MRLDFALRAIAQTTRSPLPAGATTVLGGAFTLHGSVTLNMTSSTMDRSEIAARLRTFFETEFPNPGVLLTDTTDLLDEWFVDSLGLVQTVMFIEGEFNISLSRADIDGENFQSISTLTDFITARLS